MEKEEAKMNGNLSIKTNRRAVSALFLLILLLLGNAAGAGEIIYAPILRGEPAGMVPGGYLGTAPLPLKKSGGTIVGGPMNVILLPGAEGRMIIEGDIDAVLLPGANGGMVIGGNLKEIVLPDNRGGMVIGGPMDVIVLPCENSGLIIQSQPDYNQPVRRRPPPRRSTRR